MKKNDKIKTKPSRKIYCFILNIYIEVNLKIITL